MNLLEHTVLLTRGNVFVAWSKNNLRDLSIFKMRFYPMDAVNLKTDDSIIELAFKMYISTYSFAFLWTLWLFSRLRLYFVYSLLNYIFPEFLICFKVYFILLFYLPLFATLNYFFWRVRGSRVLIIHKNEC